MIWAYLLSHEVQPALQGVGHFDLPITVVHLHTSGADNKRQQLGSKAASKRPNPLRCSLHVRGEEGVLVDANFQVVLHSGFVYGNIPLDGRLRGT